MRQRVDGHETVQAGLSWKFEIVFAWLRGVLNLIVFSSQARHV